MTFRDKLIGNLQDKLGEEFEPDEPVAEGIFQAADAMGEQMFQHLGALDEMLRSKVVLRLDAEPGWRRAFFDLQAQELTLIPVTKWALIGPTELPDWCKFNVGCLPIDDETGTVASFEGFLGVYGPDEGSDEEVAAKVEARTVERATEVLQMLLMEQGLQQEVAGLSQKVKEVKRSLVNTSSDES